MAAFETGVETNENDHYGFTQVDQNKYLTDIRLIH